MVATFNGQHNEFMFHFEEFLCQRGKEAVRRPIRHSLKEWLGSLDRKDGKSVRVGLVWVDGHVLLNR